MPTSIRQKKFRKGFTIIELVMVFVVIAIFTGMTLPYFNSSTTSKKLEQEAKQIVDVIELAKSKAMAADVSNVPGCTTFRGYEVFFDNPLTSYRLRACCSDAGSPDALCSAFQDLQVYPIQSGQTIVLSANLASPNNFIHFVNLKLGTTLSSNATIKVQNASISKCIRITVDKIGLVSEGAKQPLPC